MCARSTVSTHSSNSVDQGLMRLNAFFQATIISNIVYVTGDIRTAKYQSKEKITVSQQAFFVNYTNEKLPSVNMSYLWITLMLENTQSLINFSRFFFKEIFFSLIHRGDCEILSEPVS